MDSTPEPAPQPASVVIEEIRSGHGCLVTLLWFLFIGWWLSGLWITIAWVLIVLVVTMPIGLMMLNTVPKIATLREPGRQLTSVTEGVVTRMKAVGVPQLPFIVRALYFVLVGWWASGLWLAVAWLASLTLIGLPLTIWMYNRVPAVTTLRRF